MQSICVFTGSRSGHDPAYSDAARSLGQALGEAGITLVYGGGSVGLMNVVAEAALAAGAEVQGVITDGLLQREVAHMGLTRLHVVDTMAQRKSLMDELSEGYVALPGGIGTLDEMAEVMTALQLGMHRKPLGLCNTRGYYDHFLTFLRHAVAEDFYQQHRLQELCVDDDPRRLLDQLVEKAGETQWTG